MKMIKILKNRFFLVTIIFLGYLLIFDQYNFRAQYKLMSELSDLEEEKDFYKNELHKDSISYHTLFNNKANIEKFARERFMMKKPHEDIFIIVEED